MISEGLLERLSPKNLVRKSKQVQRHGARNVKYHPTPQIILGDHAYGMQTEADVFLSRIDVEELIDWLTNSGRALPLSSLPTARWTYSPGTVI